MTHIEDGTSYDRATKTLSVRHTLREQAPAHPRKLRHCYVMHRLNAPTDEARQENLRDASRWVAWLAEHFYLAPVANWIVLASVWPETMRERGLEIDLAQIERSELVIGVGPLMSPGMLLEGEHATSHNVPVFDMTGLPGPLGNISEGIAFSRLAKSRGYDFGMLVRP